MAKSSLVVAATAALLLNACSDSPTGSYALSSDDAVAKLLEADPRVVFMGSEKAAVSSRASNVVIWTAIDDHLAVQCTATVKETGENQSTVETGCTGASPSDGAAAGMSSDLMKVFLDEHVASTLLGRPFNARKVEMAGVAAVAKNLPAMQQGALQMDADAKAARAEFADMADVDQDMIIGETEDPAPVE